MKMLDNLKEILDDLEKKDEWAHGFVQNLLIKQEEGKLGKLTLKQWNKLLEIHERYCVQPSARERLSMAGTFRRSPDD